MKIIADDNMPLVEQFFAPLGQIQRVAGRTLSAAALNDADLLLVRSITKVNAALLADAKQLKFVGTATIGTDHLDTAFLDEQAIPWTNAAGCNAQSVVEYVLSCLFLEAERRQCALCSLRIGVVGVGQIGSRLVKALVALGVDVLMCDPPRAAHDANFTHTPLPVLLQSVDVISLHVPLIKRQHAPQATTEHLIDASILAQLPVSTTLINACRGEVVDNHALLAEQRAGRARALYLDVWEHEPTPLLALVPYCQIATAHIAGHSIEGKARGTEMLYQAVCQQLGLPVQACLADFLPKAAMPAVTLSDAFSPLELANLCRMLFDVRRDDRLFRQHIEHEGFDWLRKHYPARREFSAVTLQGQVPPYLIELGFHAEATKG